MDPDDLPLPDLPDLVGPPGIDDAPAGGAPAGALDAPLLELEDLDGERYDVWLLRFQGDADHACHVLERSLGVDEMTAENLLRSVPVALRQSVSSGAALQLEAQLRAEGADVELRASGGADPHAAARQAIAKQNTFPPSAGAVGALTAAAPARQGGSLPPDAVDALRKIEMPSKLQKSVGADEPLDVDFESGFWPRFFPTLLVPLKGWGIAWMLGLTALFFMMVFARITCIGFLMMPLFASLYLGAMATFFGQCAQAGLEDDAPGFGLPSRDEVALRGVVVGIAAAILGLLPFGAAHHGAPLPLVFALGLLPYIYWPMAVASVGLTGRLLAMFDVLLVGRAIFAGGLPYVAIVAFGFLWIAGASALLAFSLILGPLPALLAAGFFAASFSYVAGAQGALIGRLVASRPEPFRAFLPGA